MAALTIDGQPISGPGGVVGDRSSAEALFKALQDKYQWGEAITKYLVEEMELETAHDLVGAFRSEKDWNDFYAADIKEGAGSAAKQVPRGKRARVSQAHDNAVKAQTTAATIRDRGEEASDLDKPLKSEIIKSMIKAFWERYHLTPAIGKMPGDYLISRTHKEIEARFLHITDLLKIRGLQSERKNVSHKKKVADNLYTESEPAALDEDRPETIRALLECIEMYMLTLAIVGAKKVELAPQVPEVRDSDPADYVHFPYQYSLDYTIRAQEFVNDALQVHKADVVFAMLKKRDFDERSLWADKIRNHDTRTLGKIFKVVFESRKEAWAFDVDHHRAQQGGGGSGTGGGANDNKVKQHENTIRQLREQVAVLKGGNPRGQKRNADGKAAGKGQNGSKSGKTERKKPVTVANTGFCEAYNRGQCPKNNCKQAQQKPHQCSGKLPGSGQACSGNHAASECKRCLRA